MKEYSILHISDLHKGKKSSYLNLFSSLKSDCEEYIKEDIVKPEIIVVSGDLIEGAIGVNAFQEIESQYKDVERFLNDLVVYFLDGDKSRIVIVPGNHDINREYSLQSMKLSTSDPNENYKKLRTGQDDIRWSWSDFSFYFIQDLILYKSRFCQFVEFYNRFYSGIRHIPNNCEEEGYIVDIPSYNISFACFNSCYKLDHLNPAGCIYPNAISSLHDELVGLNKLGRLIIGVWHHHVSGLPSQNNYLDKRILNEMMAKHIQVGLFGHQHISDAVNEYRDLTSQNKIILISSGSLYGGDRQLPAGISRQYNIVGIKMYTHKVELTVNVRKDCSLFLYDIPAWKAGTISYSSARDISFDIPLTVLDVTYIVALIDREAQLTKDYINACIKLKDLGLKNPVVSKCVDSYIKEIDDYDFLISYIGEPNSVPQCLAILNSAIELKNKDVLNTVLNYPYVLKCDISYIIELKKQATELNNSL